MQTKWCVLDGGPSVGKSTMIQILMERGFNVAEESAGKLILDFIENNGRNPTKDEVYSEEFQNKIHQAKLELENTLPENKLIFLDRGIPSDMCYALASGRDHVNILKDCLKRKYDKVFILDRIESYEENGVRVEKQHEAEILDSLVEQAYKEAGYDIVRVPAMSPEERVEFILSLVEH